MSVLQAPSGTHDVLWPESARYEMLIGRFARLVQLAGYGLLLSPMFEDVSLFQRGVGEQSEVVSKEMYEFEDKGGRRLALRPEGTAPVVRAYLQHRPPLPWKAWYATPAFRYERPQAGRYRQHHQLGVEALGSADPDLDVEVVALLGDYLAAAGLTRLELRLNSMGDANCLPVYRDTLTAALAERADELCGEHREGYKRNPLRVLDCRKPECMGLRAELPRLADALCDPCRDHFAAVRDGLDSLGVSYRLDDYLVRGFDYYTRTTFEYVSSALDAAENAVGGGGRYDGLVELLGGPPTPGIGFGSGVERVLLAAEAEGMPVAAAIGVDVFVVDLVGGSAARQIAAELRRAGIAAERAFDGRSLKAQLKLADRSGARFVLIVGANEEETKTVTVRALRGDGPERQEAVERTRLVEFLAERR